MPFDKKFEFVNRPGGNKDQELIPDKHLEQAPRVDPEESEPGAEVINPREDEVLDPKEEFIGDKVKFKESLNKKMKLALDLGVFEHYEQLIKKAKKNEIIDSRTYDHHQRKLFGLFREKKDWDGMKRVIEDTEDYYSQTGRIKNYEHVSGLKYDGPKLEEPSLESKEKIKITNTASFRKALSAEQVDEAEQWLTANEDRFDERSLGHRYDELRKVKQKKEEQ